MTMSEQIAATTEVTVPHAEEGGPTELSRRRSLLSTAWSALTALVGTVMGLLPHVLHHVGLLGGAVLLSGATGNVVFGVLGLVLSLPVLRRLYRRFRSWKAPALALGAFGLMFSISAFLIGPAIGDDDAPSGRTRVPSPSSGQHEGHHD
jgi:hypothetical protein